MSCSPRMHVFDLKKKHTHTNEYCEYYYNFKKKSILVYFKI